MTTTRRAGTRLRAIAARVCKAEAMERVIDPLIADLQVEYGDALEQGRRWKARWVRISTGIAFLKVLAYCAGARMMAAPTPDAASGVGATAAGDGRVIGRAIAYSGTATAMFVGLLMLPVWLRMPTMGSWKVFAGTMLAIPHTIPLALPIGIALGVIVALGGRAVTRRSRRVVMLLALVGSLVSFATIAWGFAAANTVFQRTVYGARTKGVNELTLFEIRERLWPKTETSAAREPLLGRRDRGFLVLSYYVRWALSCATLVFALLGLAVLHHGRIVGIGVAVAGAIGYVCFYFFMTSLPTKDVPLPAVAVAWLPNVAILAAAGALFVVRSRRAA